MRPTAPLRAHRPLAALGLLSVASLATAGAAAASTPPTSEPPATTTGDVASPTASTAPSAAALPPGPLCAALDGASTTATTTTAAGAPATTDATAATNAGTATTTSPAGSSAETRAGSTPFGDLGSIDVLSTFVTALDDAGVSATLSDGQPYTVLAPINAAFDKIGLTLPTETTGLDTTLNLHILPGDHDAQGLIDVGQVESLSGDAVTFERRGDTLVIDGGAAAALCTEVPGTELSVILIDTVLEPGAGPDAATTPSSTATSTPGGGTVSATTGG